MTLRLTLLALLWGWAAAQEGRIGFVTPSGALATLAPDGAELRILSDGPRHQFPAWSPQGEIAVIGTEAGAAFVRVHRDEEGAAALEPFRSAGAAPIYLYWSPDGERLGFLTSAPEGTLALRVAEPEGDAYVLATGQPFYWQWQEGSAALFLHSGFAGPGARLGFSRADADTLTENLAAPGFFQAPGLSPTGKYAAYGTVDPGGRGALALRNLLEGAETQRLEHEGLVALGWSPTEDRLAFTSSPVPAPHFYGPLALLDAATGDVDVVSEDVVLAFFWSPDGRHLAYLTVAAPPQRRAPLGEAGLVRAQQPGVGLELWVHDLAAGASRRLTAVQPSPLFTAQFLPFFDQYALSHRVWSPDGAALALPVVVGGRVQVAVIDLNGEVTLVAEGDMPFWSLR
jgi:TolB protein